MRESFNLILMIFRVHFVSQWYGCCDINVGQKKIVRSNPKVGDLFVPKIL